MTDVDLHRAQDRTEELPWVESVEVRRSWPSTVVIEVVERVAVASLRGDDGAWYLVDGEGVVLGRADRPASNIASVPEFRGAMQVGDVLDRRGRALVAVADAMPETLKKRVEEIFVGETGVDLRIGRATAQIGSDEELPEKFNALAAVIDQVSLVGVCQVDIRVPATPAVWRSADCPVAGSRS